MPNAIYYLFKKCQVVQFLVNVSGSSKETSIRNHQTNTLGQIKPTELKRNHSRKQTTKHHLQKGKTNKIVGAPKNKTPPVTFS